MYVSIDNLKQMINDDEIIVGDIIINRTIIVKEPGGLRKEYKKILESLHEYCKKYGNNKDINIEKINEYITISDNNNIAETVTLSWRDSFGKIQGQKTFYIFLEYCKIVGLDNTDITFNLFLKDNRIII